MNITNNCLTLIKYYEGCRLAAYKCPAGVLTVGVGHTGPDVKPGMVITVQRADELLWQDVQRFVRDVNSLVKVPLTEGQFDALVSFAFNVGSDIDADTIAEGLGDSTLLKLVNAGRFDAAAGEFAKWNKAGGKVLDGLVRRRATEAALFRSGVLRIAK
jgi:lysozyme